LQHEQAAAKRFGAADAVSEGGFKGTAVEDAQCAAEIHNAQGTWLPPLLFPEMGRSARANPQVVRIEGKSSGACLAPGQLEEWMERKATRLP